MMDYPYNHKAISEKAENIVHLTLSYKNSHYIIV